MNVAACAACLLLAPSAHAQTGATQDDPATTEAPAADTAPAQPQPKIPKPVRVDPGSMPALPTAVIDDTLNLGGETIDAKKVRSRMTIAVRVNDTGPYRFVVDSGADSSVVGKRIAQDLKLPMGTPVTLNGITASSIVPRVIIDDLQMGPTSAVNLEVPVLAEYDLGGDGMLGIDALADQRLMLDFEKRTIAIEDSNKPAPKWDGEIVVTARRKKGQLILTQATANGKKIDAVIDTGSEITIGNTALRNEILRRGGTKFDKVEVTGVTGVSVLMDMALVRELRLGTVIFHDVAIAFADVPPFEVFGLSQEPSMLLGTDLMESFRRISLDFRHRKVRFQLKKCETQGIALRTTYGSASRLGVEPGKTAACVR